MSQRRNRRFWAGAAGVGALALAGVTGQRRHMRRIAGDPEDAVLRDLPEGRAIAVRSADGAQLHGEVFGADSGQTIVLVHGWTELLSCWSYVIRELSARSFRVVAYDLRGHGRSEPAPHADYAVARFGEDLEAVERAIRRSRRLVVNMAIIHQARVDDRLLLLFWHFAGRWGRVRGDGVLLPFRLTHTVLADLVAARRPTVTSALSDLSRRGLVRAIGEGWLLTGSPPRAIERSIADGHSTAIGQF